MVFHSIDPETDTICVTHSFSCNLLVRRKAEEWAPLHGMRDQTVQDLSNYHHPNPSFMT
jgi:hypothetical protein